MHPNDVAPMVITITFFVMTAAVILLYPLSRRLGNYLETLTQQKRHLPEGTELEPIMRTLGSIEERLARLEERQSFAEELLASGDRPRVAAPRAPGGSDAG